jgi:hypothetical protein
VIVNVRLEAQAVPPGTFVTVMLTLPQASLAVTNALIAASVGKVPSQGNVVCGGTDVITGGVVSRTVTV